MGFSDLALMLATKTAHAAKRCDMGGVWWLVFSELHLVRDGGTALACFVVWVVAVLRVDCNLG